MRCISEPQPNRRQMIRPLMCGSLMLPAAISELLADGLTKPAENPSAGEDPLAAKPPHFVPRAKRVIFLFMTGGVSHLESFDPKPKLAKDGGKKYKGRTLL